MVHIFTVLNYTVNNKL